MRRSVLVGVLCLLMMMMAWRAASEDDNVVRLVVLVHRHGARKPEKPPNASICAHTDPPCGGLTAVGFGQLRGLGHTLRDWYDKSLLPGTYEPDKIYTRTTDIGRTHQSADAFLQGLFAADTPLSPVLLNNPMAVEYLLHPATWPSSIIHREAGMSLYKDVMNRKAKEIADTALLEKIGVETNQYNVCPSDPMRCLLAAQDIEASMKAEGRLQEFPIIASLEGKLNDYFDFGAHQLFTYHPEDAFGRSIGSLGSFLANNIAHQAELLKKAEQRYLLIEYSAHDSTLVPLYVTLGESNATGTGLRPQFGEAIVFEVLQSKSDPKAVSVRAFVGYPSQVPQEKYPYTFKPYPLNCINQSNTQYTVRPERIQSAPGCPLEDWVRYLKTTAPQARGDGYCLFDANDQKKMCPAESEAVKPEQSACRNFRSLCPETACGDGTALLDYAANLTCRPISSSEQKNSVIVLIVGVFVFVCAAVGCLLLYKWVQRRAKAEGKYENVQDAS